MAYLVLFVFLLGAAILLVYAAGNMPAARMAKIVRYAGGGLLALVTLFLGLTGRLGLAVPAGLAALALFRGDLASLGGFARSIPGMGSKTAGQTSDVETGWLEMWLDHDSGEMGGRVRQGRFAGAELDRLSDEDLVILREDLGMDEESVRVLDTYLDRMRGGSGGAQQEKADGDAGSNRRSHAGGAMSREDAYDVLGLHPGADAAAIKAAHRDLMQKLHPDRGGSSYLAAQINQAKDLLLGK